MFDALRLAFGDVFSARFRSVMVKSLIWTVATLLALWVVIQGAIAWAIDIDAFPWLDLLIGILTGVGLLFGLAFLIGPVAALFAALFADEIIREIENAHYAGDVPGRDLALLDSLRDALGFFIVVIGVNLMALVLFFIPVIGVAAFFVGNGYLLGREFLEAVARRYLDRDAVRSMRQSHRGTIFAAGLVIAGLMTVPIVNIVTPLFASALMMHLYKLKLAPAAYGKYR